MIDIQQKKINVLIIDGDHETLDIFIHEFKNSRLKISIASQVSSIKKAIHINFPDIILSEVDLLGLPEFGILDYLQTLQDKPIPVIFVSFRDHPEDIITGLQTTALDYITKPFYPEEVEARIDKYLPWFFSMPST